MTRVVDVRLDPQRLSEAERLGMDVQALLEADLRKRLDTALRAEAWRAENREAIDFWNRELANNGLCTNSSSGNDSAV